MKIVFGELDKTTRNIALTGEEWLPDEAAEVAEGVIAKLTLKREEYDSVSLSGTISGKLQAVCGRCGDGVSHLLDEKFYYLVTTREEEISELPERECSSDECDTLYLKDPVIDINEILREQYFLTVPDKVVCSDDCKGLCPNCGGSLSRNECNCQETLPDTPFAVLKKLKKD